MQKLLTPVFWLMIMAITACGPVHRENHDLTVFRYNEFAGVTSLDPVFAKDKANIWPCHQLYNGLVQFDDGLRAQPCIARSWTISEDGTVYRFALRSDVAFTDDEVFKNGKGRVVTAHDVVYSLQRVVDKKVASPGQWIFNMVAQHKGQYAISAPDDSTVVIKLQYAFPPFLSLLAMEYCSVVPHEAVQFYGNDFGRHPVGTGPFKLKMWKEGVKMVLVKNEHYFEKEKGRSLPFLDAVSVSFIIDKQSAFLEFARGNLDFMSGIDPGYKDEILTRQGNLRGKYQRDFKLLRQPYLNTEYLGILMGDSLHNTKIAPLQSRAIRQAINYAFDRKKMVRYLRNNVGLAGNYGIVPPGLPSVDTAQVKGYHYNPAMARKLLAEAGFPNGDGLPSIALSTTAEYVDLCKYIQSQLADVGIPITIDVNPPATLRELKARASLPFFRASWIADYPDAENYLSMFYSGNFTPNGPNYTLFKHAGFDSLYRAALHQTNPSKRYAMYRSMDSIIVAEAPVVVLYYDEVLRFARKQVSGLGNNALNLLDLKRVQITR